MAERKPIEQLVIDAARWVSRTFERAAGLDEGALLAEAWMGADNTRRRLPEANYGNLCQGARWACMNVLKKGEKDGVRRVHERQKRIRLRLGFDVTDELRLDPAAPEEREPTTALEAREVLHEIRESHGVRASNAVELVLAHEFTYAQAAEILGLSHETVRKEVLAATAVGRTRTRRRKHEWDARPDERQEPRPQIAPEPMSLAAHEAAAEGMTGLAAALQRAEEHEDDERAPKIPPAWQEALRVRCPRCRAKPNEECRGREDAVRTRTAAAWRRRRARCPSCRWPDPQPGPHDAGWSSW